MKRHSRLRVPAVLLFAALLCCPTPHAANAQDETVEWIETGRFGTEEGGPPSTAPEETERPDKWLYAGVRLGPSLRFYTPSGDTVYTGGDTRALSLDTAFEANLRVLPFLSIQGEVIFTWDNASYWNYTRISGVTDRYSQDYTAFSLQFPLFARFDLYPGKFRVSPFLGLYFLAALGNLKTTNSLDNKQQSWAYRVSPPVGLLGGLNVGRELGPGALLIDLRYGIDLGEPEVRSGDLKTYRRSMMSLTVGYEWGFITKRENKP
ncbi:hypothetical protein LQZ21_09740 [Treponema sp. TIM-1]|uniref:hypothetical protein n=1 Tax=Treponema sp. TIM-1 TaxID=2898417 RepID=UPI00397F9DF0